MSLANPLAADTLYLLEALLAHPGHVLGFGGSLIEELTPEFDRPRRAEALSEAIVKGLVAMHRATDGTTKERFWVYDLVAPERALELVAARYAVSPLGLRSRPSALAAL